ncbi:hypothetical protein [Pseudogemmobacter sp. W21_MBD1_M6]|uniref:aspartate racemase/maleate isomerase family protein n=1 Tax=Pseudogemmobacter sp. W21_MBD1_M6 TaxID=3240271 RepID=UPI003F954539
MCRTLPARLVKQTADTAHVTNPLAAVIAACRALRVRRIGLISAYIADVSAALRQALTDCGLTVQAFASLDEETEARVARIDPASSLAARCGSVLIR